MYNSAVDRHVHEFSKITLQLRFHNPHSINDGLPKLTEHASPLHHNNLFVEHKAWLQQMNRTLHDLDTRGKEDLASVQKGLSGRVHREILALEEQLEYQWDLWKLKALSTANAGQEGSETVYPIIQTGK